MVTWAVSPYCGVLSAWPYVYRDISVCMGRGGKEVVLEPNILCMCP